MKTKKLTIISIALCLLATFGSIFTSAQTPDVRPLTIGQTVERELKGDEAHSYSLALTAGQYLDLAVEQKGIDVVVTLFDANGKKVAEVDSPNGPQGEEPLSFIVETAGNYRLEIRSPEKTAAGLYELKINELRTATEKDKNRVAANKVFAEAVALAQLGTAESLQSAIGKFKESLSSFRIIKDRKGEAETLGYIGYIFAELGEQQQALNYYNQSLPLLVEISDKEGEGTMHNNIGKVYSVLGEKQKALESYNQSLLLRRAIGDKEGEASTLTGIGTVYLELGEKQQALKYLKESLSLHRAIGNKNGEADTLNSLGGLYSLLGEQQKALENLKISLILLREIGEKNGEANTLSNIGAIYSYLGEKQQSLKYLKESLLLRRAIGDKNGEANTLNNIGRVYADIGDIQQALKYLNESLLLRRVVSNLRGEAGTLDNLFDTVASSNPRLGVFYGKQSIKNLQILRSNVQKLDNNIQQTFLKSIENTFRRLADELIKQNRYAEAQQVLNAFKDQQYFDFNQSKQLAPLAFTAREAELTATLNQKLENVVAAIRAFDEYKRSVGERPPIANETAKLKLLAAEQTAANDDYLAFLKSAEKEFAAPLDGKDKVPVISDLTELQTALREVSIQTGEKSVAIYTLVGVDNYRALVVTSDSIFSVSTPIKGAMLNEKAQQLWYLLQRSQYDPQPLAKEIYDVVFAPLAAKLPADTKTILWSLDGSLRYLPMAALFDGKQYLVELYNNVVFTRADTKRLTRKVSANLTGTGFGATKDRRVKVGSNDFYFFGLPSVKPELSSIFKFGDSPNGVLSGEVLFDEKFTRPAMISALQKRRPLVHIASHFKFEPGDEAKSFLVLGDGSAFTLDEMKEQKDLFAGVELLALSACDTAAQQEDANGREIDGFAELAQRLGAGAVMASLWSVSDNSTTELMTRFYKTYDSQKGTNKAASLKAAQIAVLRGEFKTNGAVKRPIIRDDAELIKKLKIDVSKLKPFKVNKNEPFAHPFFWSPFILIGNWK